MPSELLVPTDNASVINDEQPALTDWVIEKFSNGTTGNRPPFNRFMYSKVFELLLRLKANYLWPGTTTSPSASRTYVCYSDVELCIRSR